MRCIVPVVIELGFEIDFTESLHVKMKTANYLHKETSEVLNINMVSLFWVAYASEI